MGNWRRINLKRETDGRGQTAETSKQNGPKHAKNGEGGKKEAGKKETKAEKDKPCRLYTAARTIAWRQSRVLLGTLADVLKSVRMDGNTVARPSALIWREDSGLSHLVATKMVGRLELCRAAVVFPTILWLETEHYSHNNAGHTLQNHKAKQIKQIKRESSSTCAAASFRGK